MTSANFSQLSWRLQLYDDEEDENYHLLIFADKNTIYYWDPFINGYPIRPLAVGFEDIRKLVINIWRDFLFIIDYIEEEEVEIVYRYAILWDFNDTSNPVIFLNKTSKIIQY